MIIKGKVGVPYELGLNVCVARDQFGNILGHAIMEKTSDEEICLDIVNYYYRC